MKILQVPDFAFEQSFVDQGYLLVAGLDEAGRAPLAGPVSAAAVILDLSKRPPWLDEVNDSKILSPGRRENLEAVIIREALAWGVGIISAAEIDEFGIARAARLAMIKAIRYLDPQPNAVIIDHFRLPECNLPQRGITRGDSRCLTIACASILAKVVRDRLMQQADELYPGYGFSRNKGYPTPEHLAALRNLGPCEIHRRSFRPLRPALEMACEF
jgi:ribonuclease HII